MLVLALQFSKGNAQRPPAIRKPRRATTAELDHLGAGAAAAERDARAVR